VSRTRHRGIAVYTGTFDPVHLGHLDIIVRGSTIFDRLVVGVGSYALTCQRRGLQAGVPAPAGTGG